MDTITKGTKRFSNSQALSSALTVLEMIQPQSFRLLNHFVPLILVSVYLLCISLRWCHKGRGSGGSYGLIQYWNWLSITYPGDPLTRIVIWVRPRSGLLDVTWFKIEAYAETYILPTTNCICVTVKIICQSKKWSS